MWSSGYLSGIYHYQAGYSWVKTWLFVLRFVLLLLHCCCSWFNFFFSLPYTNSSLGEVFRVATFKSNGKERTRKNEDRSTKAWERGSVANEKLSWKKKSNDLFVWNLVCGLVEIDHRETETEGMRTRVWTLTREREKEKLTEQMSEREVVWYLNARKISENSIDGSKVLKKKSSLLFHKMHKKS